MKKLVIFDLDGTLTDTLDSIERSANLTLDAFGYAPIERDQFRYFVGNGAQELIRKCLLHHGSTSQEELGEVFALYQQNFRENCMYHVRPYDGIPELLQALKDLGVRMAVNSNKPHPSSVKVVEEIFGRTIFDCIIGQSDGRRRKPAPDGVYAILEALSVEKDDVIYIGDTDTDMETGKSAGVFTVGALWGFRDEQELRGHHADAVIEKPMELLHYIKMGE